MSENMIMILCALIGSGAATALVSGLVSRRAEKRRTETGESQGMRWLLQDRLEHLARHYLDRGYISYEELKNWNKGHAIYHDLLGGNGDLNTLKEALHVLYKKGEKKNDP